MKQSKKLQFTKWTLSALLVAGLTACASSGVAPVDTMASARAAIAQAEATGASQNAPVELLAARDAFTKAEGEVRAERFKEAKQWAEEAEVNGQLASRKSRAVKAQKAADELTKSNELLRAELARKTRP